MSSRRPCGAAVGRHWTEIETPALLLHIDIARENITRMAAWVPTLPVDLRPHFKAHKCIELARLQLEAGAVGVTVATVTEATALVDAGIDDVLVANQVVQSSQMTALADAATRARVCALVDDAANLEALAEAARQVGSEIGAMVEADIGMGRCGARDQQEASALADLAVASAGIRFDGVSAYEGHCTGIVDRSERRRCTEEAIGTLGDLLAAIEADGLAIPAVSAGGTSTFDVTGSDPRVTELQPGAYALMDLSRRRLIADFEIALTVAATVISRHGSRVVLDCGLKAVNSKQRLPQIHGLPGEVDFVDEEHLRFDATTSVPCRGDRVEVIPGYGPLTINLYDRFHVISAETVVAEWPVAARR
ncbi:MAG TPA: alanine racemase [Solirubrobacterales bacterium]|nr:alanine racemase [Solirubrobacterales bacterium]